MPFYSSAARDNRLMGWDELADDMRWRTERWGLLGRYARTCGKPILIGRR